MYVLESVADTNTHDSYYYYAFPISLDGAVEAAEQHEPTQYDSAAIIYRLAKIDCKGSPGEGEWFDGQALCRALPGM